MTTKEAAQATLDKRWNLSRYSTGFELIWQWIECWLFGHIIESKVVLKTKGAVSTNYWCTRCGDAYGMTSGLLSTNNLMGTIPYEHLAILLNGQLSSANGCGGQPKDNLK